MANTFPIAFEFEGKRYQGQIKPFQADSRRPKTFQVFLNNAFCGVLKQNDQRWESDSPRCALMASAIGNSIYDWYDQA